MDKKTIEKYILSKPWNVGRFNCTFPDGTILEVDKKNDMIFSGGREFKGLAEFVIALRIKDARTGIPLVIPYSEKNSLIKDITSAVKNRMQEKKIEVQRYKIIQSDSDLVDDIDISHVKKATDKKGQEKLDKNAKLEVIRESEISIPAKKNSMEEIQKRIDSKKPLNLTIVKDDSLGLGTGEKADVKIQPKSSIKVKKGK